MATHTSTQTGYTYPKPVRLVHTGTLAVIQDAQQDRQHLHGSLVGYTDALDGTPVWVLSLHALESESEAWTRAAIAEANHHGAPLTMTAYLPPMMHGAAMGDAMRRDRLLAARAARLASR